MCEAHNRRMQAHRHAILDVIPVPFEGFHRSLPPELLTRGC